MVCILELKTTQSVHIRTMIEALNPLLTDANMHFYPNIIKGTTASTSDTEDRVGGVIIKEVNKTSSILIHCKLEADKFDSYYYNYKNDKLTIGINLSNFLKCIKCMTNCDTMTWRIDDDDIWTNDHIEVLLNYAITNKLDGTGYDFCFVLLPLRHTNKYHSQLFVINETCLSKTFLSSPSQDNTS
jgi:hypothetical protein